MRIGIDASRAFLDKRTGIEEYSYQVIKHLRDQLDGHKVVLYVRKTDNLQLTTYNSDTVINNLKLPKSWKVKVINMPRLWTQLGLSLEMLLRPVDVLFIPAHTVPFIHPKKTVVTIHGLEYEFCPEAYSFWERFYMRLSIKKSCKWASRIISVSENTKADLMRLYNVSEKKIEVIYEGYENCITRNVERETKDASAKRSTLHALCSTKYLLFVGRIEERKNIVNIVKAFEILKEKYGVPHKLVLAGKPGYNYENIKLQITNSKHKEDIIELGYVSDEEKFELMKNADAFVFPTLYEGFGIPVLEAQSMGCPVVAGNNSSIPEVVGVRLRKSESNSGEASALLVDPKNPEAIAKAMALLINDRSLREEYVQKGLENVKRFSWEKCAEEVAEVTK